MDQLYYSSFNLYSRCLKGILVSILFLLTTTDVLSQSYPEGFNQVEVAGSINNPTVMAFAPDGRIFVAEQGGRLHVIKNGAKLATPAIQLTVNSSGERGLIGIALHPDFEQNGYVYLYYTLSNGSRNRISRFTISGDVINPSSEVVILNLDPLSGATNHNGGAMHFKGDKLYVAIGENANTAHAQNLDTYHGKLLRINADGSAPTDNPFYSSTASEQRKRIWAYGLRNPYTFDIQASTGKVFVNDVGQNTWEEINDATTGGLNFGWPATEGATSNPAYASPVFSYAHGSGDGRGCAITGGVFFDASSTNYPATYAGKYFYQDLCNRWINYVDISSGVTRHAFATNIAGNALALDVGTDGSLYYLSRTDRKLYKIIYSVTAAPVITNQPDNLSVSVGQSASFSVSASGTAPLSYQWRRNGVNISGATSATYSISNVQQSHAGQYTVVVSNAAGAVTSTVATLTVTSFNEVPTASITTPSAEALYRGGDVINFSGTASDPEDGPLAAGAFTWFVDFHHDDHVHDGPPVAQGVTSGSFTIPTTGETAVNVFYRLYLVVNDSQGLKDTAFVDINPRTSTITLNTHPAGLKVTLDGQPINTPHTEASVEGIIRSIGVVSPQQLNNTTYQFSSWSNGGSQTQSFATPTDNITLTANFTASELPSPWQSQDIGGVAASGSASYNAGIFSVAGSGSDIWGTSDEFHYVYQPFTGDGEIVARVESITNSHAWAKAGIMIRETLGANSKHAFAMVSASQGRAFQRRVTTGGTSANIGASGSAPVWVRLTRSGNTFIAYSSGNGSTWTQIGSAVISMTNQVYVGLAVTSHSDGIINNADFSQVSISSTSFAPQVYEAETAQLSGATVASNQAGYTGTGFADYLNPSNDYIEWTFDHPVAGSVILEFRYALGASASRPLNISVNGNVVASSLAFPSTGSWTIWQTVRVNASLAQGANIIRATAVGSSGANLDHLKVLPSSSALSAGNRTSTELQADLQADLYPNPVGNKVLNIDTNSPIDTEKANLKLTDVSGKEYKLKIMSKEGANLKLDVGDLPPGVYVLKIRHEERLIQKKVIIQ